MKKKLINAILVVMCVCGLLCGCESEASSNNVLMGKSMEQIENDDSLFYRKDTKIVYITIAQRGGVREASTGYGYMAPYYSENGKLCRYVDGKIVEVK